MALEKVLALGSSGVIEKEIDIGSGGGGTDDGVTADNICDLAMDGTTVINQFRPIYYKPNVGVAQLLTHGIPATAPNQYGTGQNTQTNSGTGATTAQTAGILGEIAQSAGTTATGYSTFYVSLAPDYAVVSSNFYNLVSSPSAVGMKMSARLAHYISAVSDATNAYSASITLFGRGPITNGAISATTSGFTISYTHAVNSGNFVINYRGADGTLKTVNTTVAPGVGLANAKTIIAKAHRTGAADATVTIDIAGTVYTITDSDFNLGTTYIYPMFGSRILKSAGTTARSQTFRHIALATNLP